MFRIREATLSDREVITHHRVSMLSEMGVLSLANVVDMREATMAYLADAMPSGVGRANRARSASTLFLEI